MEMNITETPSNCICFQPCILTITPVSVLINFMIVDFSCKLRSTKEHICKSNHYKISFRENMSQGRLLKNRTKRHAIISHKTNPRHSKNFFATAAKQSLKSHQWHQHSPVGRLSTTTRATTNEPTIRDNKKRRAGWTRLVLVNPDAAAHCILSLKAMGRPRAARGTGNERSWLFPGTVSRASGIFAVKGLM